MLTFTSTLSEIVVENGSGWIPHCYTSPPFYNIIFYIILVIFTLFNIAICAYNLYKLNSESGNYHIGIKILFNIINILFAIGGVAYCIHLGLGFGCVSIHGWDAMGLTGLNCYFYGLALLYLLYLVRLWMIFHSTGWLEISKYILFICLLGFIAQISMTPLSTYYFILLLWPQAVTFMTIFTFLNSIFSFFLLYLFWSKTYKLGKSISIASGAGSVKNVNEIAHSMQKNMTILSPAIKYSICAFGSILSSQLVNIVAIWRAYIGDTEFLWGMHLTIIVVDECVNLLFVLLQFNYGQKYYSKILIKTGIHPFIETKLVTKMSRSASNTSTPISSNVPKLNLSVPSNPSETPQMNQGNSLNSVTSVSSMPDTPTPMMQTNDSVISMEVTQTKTENII